MFGLKEHAKCACDLKAEGLGDSTRFEVVENDGVVRFIQCGLDDRSFTHVDLRCQQGMNRNAMGAVLDATKGVDFLPSCIFGMTSGEFLADFLGDDDFADQLCQRIQSSWQDGVEMNGRASVYDGHAACGRRSGHSLTRLHSSAGRRRPSVRVHRENALVACQRDRRLGRS